MVGTNVQGHVYLVTVWAADILDVTKLDARGAMIAHYEAPYAGWLAGMQVPPSGGPIIAGYFQTVDLGAGTLSAGGIGDAVIARLMDENCP